MPVVPAPQPDEYEKLGSYAMIGLPMEAYPTRCGPAMLSGLLSAMAYSHGSICHPAFRE